MEPGIFTDKSAAPDDEALAGALGKQFSSWAAVKGYVLAQSPAAKEEWNYSKYGWSCRIKGKKSVIIYLMPYSGYFTASFVLGRKASEEALAGNLANDIKDIISAAKVYAEGRGFRIDVKNAKVVADIKTLIDIKLS